MTTTELYERARNVYREAGSMLDVAKEFQCSKQYVYQVYKPTEADKQARARVAPLRRLQEILEAGPPICCIPGCGCFVLRAPNNHGTHRTCSPEHAKLWARDRVKIDKSEKIKHRLINAKSILKHQEKRPEEAVRWAKKVLEKEGFLIH